MKKRLSLLMVLMMVLSLVPMSAFATAGTVPGGIVSVEDNETTVKKVTVKLTQAAYDDLKAGESKLTLSGADFAQNELNNTDLASAEKKNYTNMQMVRFNADGDAPNGTIALNTTAALDVILDDVALVDVPAVPNLAKDMDIVIELYLLFDQADAGDVTLTVDEVDTTGLKVADPIKVAVVKEATSDELTMVVTNSEKKISVDGGALSRTEIKNFDDTTAKVFVLELPDFMSWEVVGTTNNVDTTKTNLTVIGGTVDSFVRDADDNNVATLTLDATGAKSIIVEPFVAVKAREASMGDINLKVTATGTNYKETVSEVIGQLADYDATMTAVEKGEKKIPSMYGGETETVKVTISGVKGTFSNGRTIDFTVEGADVESVTAKTALTGNPGLDDGEFSFKVDGTNEDELVFEMEIKADYAEAGEVVLTAESRDFGTLECNVAEVTPAFTVEVSKITDIKKGESLATADVVIKEAKAGILDSDQYLVLNLNDKNRETLSFASDYTVEATNGLKVDDDLFNDEGGSKNALGTLVIEIESSSVKEAGVITLSDVVVNVDGATVDGVKTLDVFVVEDGDDYDFRTSGSQDVADKSVTNMKSAVEYIDAEEPDADYEIDYVNVVKEYGATATTTVFVIGSKTYTVNGVQMTANEAPYVAGKGYTMLPVRALAESLGLKADWNSNTKTATFSNDSKVASVTLGADTMYVNGTPIPLNAKAEIKNGSTFVELRSLASAFSVELQWDAATKTVTVIG